MSYAPSKLFHAVVVTGAALTGCAGTTPQPQAASDATAAPSSSAATLPAATSSPGKCPPGSERPYPPCYWIK